MSSRTAELFDQGLDFIITVVLRLGEHDWARPTPCAGWNARDLLGHLATSMWVAISTMQGRQPTWPDVRRPGDLVEGDPVEFWQATVVQARDVRRDADLSRAMETPLGTTVADDLAIPVIDLYVHAWDFGSTVGIAVEIPTDVIDYAHAYIDPLPHEMMRGEAGRSHRQLQHPPTPRRPNDSLPGPDASYRR